MQKIQSKSYFAFMVYVGVFLLTFFIGNAHEITLEIPLYNATTYVALDYDDVDEDTPMGYVLLSKMSNAEKLLQAYDAIDICMAERQESVSLSTLGLTVTEFENVIDACISDHPEYFWIDSSVYAYTYIPGVLVIEEAFPEYIMSASEIAAAKPLVESEAQEILEDITSDMTDYEIEKYIHDTLAMTIDYVESVDDGTIYGALVLDECVCEGYARALQYLLNKAGVETYYVTGASETPSTGEVIGHAWNLVELDNEYYYVDLTWDDQGNTPAGIFYSYFNVTEDYINEDHVFSPIDDTETGKEYYAYLPDATGTKNNYFVKNNRTIDMATITVAQVANLIKNPLDGAARAFYDGDAESLISWWNSHCDEVATEVGINGSFLYGYKFMGDEVHFLLCADGEIQLDTPGPITIEINDEYKVVASVVTQDTDTVTLTWSSDNTAVAIVDSTGNVIAKAPGSATITVTSGEFSKEVVFYVTESTPEAKVSNGYLVNLIPNGRYAISHGSAAVAEHMADSQGKIPVLDAWKGSDIQIVKLNSDAQCNSSVQTLSVPLDSTEITVAKAADGKWYAYLGNRIAYDYTGLAANEYGIWYIIDGEVDFTYDDVIKTEEYGWICVRDGKYATDYTGIAKNSLGWWRIESGKVNFSATGVYQNELGWWYCENGKVNFSYTGIKNNSNGWWRIESGKVNFSATGVYQNELGWWYCENGKVNFGYTGIKNNANGWWRIENGKVNFSATGVYQNELGWWYCKNGKVDFSFTGIASNSNGWWYCAKGKVDFSKTGSVYYAGRYYSVKGGKVV